MDTPQHDNFSCYHVVKGAAPVYDKAYFIAKFEAIPEDQWTDKGLLTDGYACCALGHCGATGDGAPRYTLTPEAQALADLFGGIAVAVTDINDGWTRHRRHAGAKQRILAALHELP